MSEAEDALIASTDLLRRRKESLDELSAPAVLLDSVDPTRCTACAHRCVLAEEGRRGACGVRFRRGGEIRVPFGYVARRYVRPVETNTVFHVLPGASALTFGMFGCDLRCPYCHNWQVSQPLRDTEANAPRPLPIEAAALAREAAEAGCQALCAAYNEPMIAAEWLHAVFTAARALGLVTVVVSDGHTTREALEYLRPVADVFRVDLKGFEEAQYRTLGGRLAPVLEGIRTAKALGYWVEVVTLVVPDFNDDPRGLRALGAELRDIDAEIPWHLNAFQPRYRMKDRRAMSYEPLMLLAGAAYARGSSYVYVNNVPDASLSSTRCPSCHTMLVERRDYRTERVLLQRGACPTCERPIPGIFTTAPRSPSG